MSETNTVARKADEDVDNSSMEATAYTPSESDDQPPDIVIPWWLIVRGLQGVATATKAEDGEAQRIVDAISAVVDVTGPGYSLSEWRTLFLETLDASMVQRATLAIVMAHLCYCGRSDIPLSPTDLDRAWSMIKDALRSSSIPYTVSRSAQGFLAVPLWSVINNGNIEELFRLHVWLPDGLRGASDVAKHAHQAFAQSWTLAGQLRNYVYDVHPADASDATHAEYAVGWSDSGNDKTGTVYHDYKTHQKSSTVVNTGKQVRIASETSEVHSRNMMYTVPAGVIHYSEVAPDILHATLFLFDASRGFEQIAPVLGPVDQTSYTQHRHSAGTTAAELVQMVDIVRSWEDLYEQGLQHCREAKWEEALQVQRSAFHLVKELPYAFHYKYVAMAEIGHTYRMLGRYQQASETLEAAIRDMPHSIQRVACTGELAVVYRHIGRLEDAKRACEEEYSTAKHLNLRREMCRAVGNLGMVNYQLYLDQKDSQLLDLAMAQLNERVEIARELKYFAATQLHSPGSRAEQMSFASQREAIALSRLSLCYTEKKQIDKAIESALEALEVTYTQDDPTKIAFSMFFYGRALLLAGKKAQAMAVFNPPPNTCTPTIALCREPSAEHRKYILEMIDAGADMELRDEQGYSALDCAVYAEDKETQMIIERGLRIQYERRFERHLYEAVLRKGYRDVIQDILRPILLRAEGAAALGELRQAYSAALEVDAHKSDLFDRFKTVRYNDFLRCGEIPRSSTGIATPYLSSTDKNSLSDFVVFLSYRWIANDPGRIKKTDSPDDINNTQYHRMVRGLEEFLLLHPHIDRGKLRIWVVS